MAGFDPPALAPFSGWKVVMDRQKRAASRLMNANEPALLLVHSVNCCRIQTTKVGVEGELGGFGVAGSNETAALSPGSASHLKADRRLS